MGQVRNSVLRSLLAFEDQIYAQSFNDACQKRADGLQDQIMVDLSSQKLIQILSYIQALMNDATW